MKNILFIIGSLRKDSFNAQLAAMAEADLQGKARVTYLDYKDLPWMDQDVEFPAPEAVTRVREAVAQADGLWIFTPEYNYSYPAHLKNLLDWLSRPLVAMDYETPTCIRGKKTAVTGAGGKNRTETCRRLLTDLLDFLGAQVQQPQLGIELNVEAWTEGRMMLTPADREALQQQAEALVAAL